MNSGRVKLICLFPVLIMASVGAIAQISPGDLSKPHEHLEGISNCTKCHTIGNKITGDKCLACHTEIKERITAGKGYHSSSEPKSKQCIDCHSEHHGKNFQIIRFDIKVFDHNLAGYKLSEPHAALECTACHDKKNIADQQIKAKAYTYLGLKTECLTCHADYHLNTLSSSCLNCHQPESFKTAPLFNHNNARFRLAGKHKTVECIKCHRMETLNGASYQEFRGIPYSSCANCHKDPHQDKYGQNCRRCHNEESFSNISGLNNFDHENTGFPLRDKHLTVDCKSCHKTKFTDPVKHDRCTDCHTDYHKGQFARDSRIPDCSDCHNLKGFTNILYTIDQHNQSQFPLRGAHSSQPCSECHRKQPEWSFKGIGTECHDCHPDIHKLYIGSKYYPDQKCIVCHNENTWRDVRFDHSATDFPLKGAHAKVLCATCHITRTPTGEVKQKFSELKPDCFACHKDNHQGQFDRNGITNCSECHDTENWKPSGFDHNRTAFKIEGKHIGVPCAGCHKPQQTGQNSFILYKIKDYRCESCHSF